MSQPYDPPEQQDAPGAGPAPYGQAPYGQQHGYPQSQPGYPQAPYPQAPYPQAPYPQPPYGQAPYPQAPYGGTGYGLPPTRRRTPVLVWVGVAVVLVVAVALAFVLIGNAGSTSSSDAAGTAGRHVTLPSSIDGYAQITSIDTNSVKQQLGSQLSGLGTNSSAAVAHAQLGVYGKGQAPGVVFIALQLSDVPKLKGQVDSDGVRSTLRSFVSGVSERSNGTSAKDVDPGRLGGSMRCLDSSISGQPVGVCGWGDRSAFAITIVVSPTSTDATATLTRDLRNAAEK